MDKGAEIVGTNYIIDGSGKNTPQNVGENSQDFIKWEKRFELGIPVIDAQHKHLVQMCNSLYIKVVKSRLEDEKIWKAALIEALKECADYVQIHFRDEEILMKAAGYENLASHKKTHESFIRKILEVVQNFDSATTSTAINFVKFLYEWIISHVALEDKLYVKSILNYYASTKS